MLQIVHSIVRTTILLLRICECNLKN